MSAVNKSHSQDFRESLIRQVNQKTKRYQNYVNSSLTMSQFDLFRQPLLNQSQPMGQFDQNNSQFI